MVSYSKDTFKTNKITILEASVLGISI